MHQRTFLFPAFTALILLAPALPAADVAAAPAYTINISPPNKVGQKSTQVADYTDHVQQIISGPMDNPSSAGQVQTNLLGLHLEVEIEVLAVFPNGAVQKEALTVTKFTGTQNNQALAGLVSPGTAIVVTQEPGSNKKTYTVDGQPLANTVASLLQRVVSLGRSDHTDQDLMGPKTPVAIGATWAPDTKLITEESKESLGTVTNAQGQLRLDAVQGTGDDQVVTVSGAISLQSSKSPLPPSYVCEPLQLKSELNGSFPATRTKGTAKDTTTVTISVTGVSTNPANQEQTKITFTEEQKTTKVVTFH